MRSYSTLCFLVGISSCSQTPQPATGAPAEARAFAYPHTHKVDQVDDYHGTSVADPYRWIEDLDSEQTAAWVAAQNELTFGFLARIPARQDLRARLTALWDYEKYGIPIVRNGRYFFSRNDGLQNQSVLYTTRSLFSTAPEAAPRVLLDPNLLSEDGTVHLAGFEVSDDGRLLAYGLASAGSDWNEWRVRDVETGNDLPDHLRWIKFSGASFLPDSSGFYYSRFPEPRADAALEELNFYNKLYFHEIGTDQTADRLIYERPDHKDWGFSGEVSEDGQYLIISVTKGTDANNMVLFRDLAGEDKAVNALIDDFDAEYTFLGNEGSRFFVKTTLDAPRGRVIAIETAAPSRGQITELISEAEATIEQVSLVGERFIIAYLEDAHSVVKLFDLAGRPVRELELPGIGSAWGFPGRRSDRETFYAYSSFATPTEIYRLDVDKNESRSFRKPEVAFDPTAYETTQLFATSKDGTRVPVFVTHKKGLALNGNNPTYLYGYGGFNISISPWFSVSWLVWMEMGGVLAVASLRGGGEYGEQWHDAGRLANKQNVFDDFAAVAEHLIATGYTRTPKLAIGGASNGGLLVGASLLQRPDLFGAGIAGVGVFDMLRFHRFTIGWAWVDDYGSADDPEQLQTLLAYSPLHNVKPGAAYPALLLTTADHDDRVVPSHSFKFAATMQAAQGGPAPILIRIETRAGHGRGKPTSKQIEEAADGWAFLVEVLGVDRSPVPAPVPGE